jgi:hypothetical protein
MGNFCWVMFYNRLEQRMELVRRASADHSNSAFLPYLRVVKWLKNQHLNDTHRHTHGGVLKFIQLLRHGEATQPVCIKFVLYFGTLLDGLGLVG